MGASGDMLMGALYELCPDREGFLRDMNRLLPGVTLTAESVTRQGIAGAHMRVVVHGREEGHHHHDHDHEHHHHRSLGDIREMIGGFDLPQAVRDRAMEVYGRIAQAESAAHGVWASPVTVGSGTVRTAHGLLPVPAPATARLLEGVPVVSGDIAAELCTPTGAALLRAFAGGFGPMPEGVVRGCGYGCGTKDFPRANCLRAFWLDTAETGAGPNDTVTELKANIDDMTGEELGQAMEALLEAGALDVSYVPLQMKKHRPGALLLCLCRPAEAHRLAREILRLTSTFGVRRTDCPRYALAVTRDEVETPLGTVARKTGTGWGIVKSKPEYADLAAIAREKGVSLAEVRRAYEGAR